MGKRLLVKNLNRATSNEQLSRHIQEIGKVVSVRIATDNVTFQSTGEASVEMESAEEVQKVFSVLNGKEFMGSELNISVQG